MIHGAGWSITCGASTQMNVLEGAVEEMGAIRSGDCQRLGAGANLA